MRACIQLNKLLQTGYEEDRWLAAEEPEVEKVEMSVQVDEKELMENGLKVGKDDADKAAGESVF